MIEIIKKIFGRVPSVDYAQLTKSGAVILDVRSKHEYTDGHIKGSVNIAVDQLPTNLNRFKSKEQPIITCCASGVRSAAAQEMLKSKGFTHVFNGGSWYRLQQKIK